MDEELKKSIILEHYNNPINKKLTNDEGYYKINMNSASCIDNLDYMIKIKDGIVVDAMFDGDACAISTAASSIVTDMIIGKDIKDVLNILNNYEAMIDERKYDEELLGEANCFCDVGKQANRKKCALLPIEGIKKILEMELKNER